ncbi:MAG TPA: 4-vinyl reductase [Chloroflexi bacterium]|jgi:predicted hydrocarbon binding protein|nr:4-vinyl reductase [Chloroflexota bacterium]
MSNEQKYRFSWDLLGNIPLGRPNLGPRTRLEVYRLMQFTLRDVLERHVGAGETDRIFLEAGRMAGVEFYRHFLGPFDSFSDFANSLQAIFKEMDIGILRFEQSDLDSCTFLLTVSEDMDCSGLPELGYEICTYDEGFIAGLLEEYTGLPLEVQEIDCWCTGSRTCRFRARPAAPSA